MMHVHEKDSLILMSRTIWNLDLKCDIMATYHLLHKNMLLYLTRLAKWAYWTFTSENQNFP